MNTSITCGGRIWTVNLAYPGLFRRGGGEVEQIINIKYKNKVAQLNKIIRDKQFKLRATMPGSWEYISLNLKRGADKLYDCYYDATMHLINKTLEEANKKQIVDGTKELTEDEIEDVHDSLLISIYLMLMGYSIENLLKAIIMLEHPEYYRPDAKITNIKDHRLVELCKCCNIRIKPDEATLLKELTIYIEWKGRYPIPLKALEIPNNLNSDGTAKEDFVGFRGRKTQEEIDMLYMKIWNELEKRKSEHKQ
jgi:hypothetical protein